MSKTSGFLKDNFFGSVSAKTSAVVLAGLMSLAPIGGKLGTIFGGTNAHAQDSAEAATLPPDFNKVPVSIRQNTPPVPQDGYTVPVKDMNEFRPRVAERAAAAVSMKGIIVLVSGNNSELLETAKRAAHDAKQEGAHILGIIDGGGTVDDVRIYFGGIVHSVDGLTSYEDIKGAIKQTDQERHEFVAALGQPQ